MTPFQACLISLIQDIAVILFSAVVFLITKQDWVWVFTLLAWVPLADYFMDKYGRL